VVGGPRFALPLMVDMPGPLAVAILCLIGISVSAYLCRRLNSLRFENRVLRALVYDQPDVGVAEFRFGRVVEGCNPTLERMFGLSRDEIIGKSLPLPECRRSQWEELEAGLRTGVAFWDVETVRVRADDSLFRAYISGIPIIVRNRIVVGYFGMITEEKWIEKRGAEALKLAALADNSSDFLLLLNRDLRITYANPTVAAMTGIDLDLIEGTHILECFAEDDRDAAREYLEEFLKSAMNDEYSPRLKLRDRETGVETLVQFGIYPVFESPGEGPTAIACVGKDRSDETALGKQLRLKQKEMHAVFEHLPVGIVTLDAQGSASASNGMFQQLLGYTQDEILRSSFAAFIHPEDQKEGRRRFLELVAGNVDHYEIEQSLVDKNGRGIRVQTTVVLTRREDGKTSHVTVIVVPLDSAPRAG